MAGGDAFLIIPYNGRIKFKQGWGPYAVVRTGSGNNLRQENSYEKVWACLSVTSDVKH
jgi:hypothetical protein